MKINDTTTLQDLTTQFDRYEKALVTNDLAVLDELFWDNPNTLRYGAGENLYGIDEIRAFRDARPSKGLDRAVLRTHITTFGDDFATTQIEFRRTGAERIGR
ncbi:MAG: oxalurate catabolism protein HpxZ, partial [Haliea sp.]